MLTCRKAALAVAGLCLPLIGCASMPPPLAEVATGSAYALGPGDKLRITVYNETALTGEYIVTPNGNIAFPLVGDIPAKDATVEVLQTAIATKLAAGYVRDPRVSAEILTFRPFYILGEVNRPGEYPYSSGLTLGQAVAVAGGYTYRANKKTVFLRRARSAERSVDLHAVPVDVMPGDTIRVGERYF